MNFNRDSPSRFVVPRSHYVSIPFSFPSAGQLPQVWMYRFAIVALVFARIYMICTSIYESIIHTIDLLNRLLWSPMTFHRRFAVLFSWNATLPVNAQSHTHTHTHTRSNANRQWHDPNWHERGNERKMTKLKDAETDASKNGRASYLLVESSHFVLFFFRLLSNVHWPMRFAIIWSDSIRIRMDAHVRDRCVHQRSELSQCTTTNPMLSVRCAWARTCIASTREQIVRIFRRALFFARWP